MIQPNHITIFEDYLSGNLSQTDLVEFESKLKKDIELKSQLEAYRDIKNKLTASPSISEDAKQFQDNIHSIGRQYFDENTNKKTTDIRIISKKKWRIAYGVAACLALFAVIKFAFFNPDLYQQNQVYASISLQTRGNGNENKSLTEAIESYNKKDFKTAVHTLTAYADTLTNTNPQVVNAAIIANTEVGNYEVSLRLINKQLSNKELLPNQLLFSQYQKALLYLKQKNKEQAKTALKELAKMSGFEDWALKNRIAKLSDKLD